MYYGKYIDIKILLLIDMCDCSNRILISTNPQVYICGCDEEETSSEEDYNSDDDLDEMIIIYDECLITTIAQIEKNIRNGVPIDSIYIFINNDNEDKEDVYNLIKNIYENINFLLDTNF